MMAIIVSCTLWISSLLTFLIGGGLYFLLCLVVPPRHTQMVAKHACRLILLAAGQRIRLSGKFPELSQGPYIYIFNHTSLLDTFITVSVLPEFTGAIGKQEQFDVPLWGWILRRRGAMPIDRSDAQGAIKRLDTVEKTVREGLSLLIAPEGTRSPDGQMLPFKKGPFHIAVNAKASIVPLAITGAYRAKNKQSWRLTPGFIDVHVTETIRHDTEWTVDELRAEAQNRIQTKLNEG